MPSSRTVSAEQLADALLFGSHRIYLPCSRRAGLIQFHDLLNNCVAGMIDCPDMQVEYDFLNDTLDRIYSAIRGHEDESGDDDNDNWDDDDGPTADFDPSPCLAISSPI